MNSCVWIVHSNVLGEGVEPIQVPQSDSMGNVSDLKEQI